MDQKAAEALTKAVEDAVDKIDTIVDMDAKREERLKAIEKAAKDTETWMAEQERKLADRRSSLLVGDNLKAVIPTQYHKHFEVAQIMAAQYKDQGGKREPGQPACILADDPILKTGVGLWLAGHLMKLTKPADFMARKEMHDKLTEILGSPVQRAALAEGTSGVGQELVPTIVEAEILRLVADNGIMRPLVRKVPMTTRTHAYPTRANAFSAAIIDEGSTITDSVPSTPFSQSNLTAKKLAAFATVSSELMQDNVVLLADYLATEFGEQIARTEDKQALEGDGTGSNFTGVVAASGVNSVSSGSNGDRVYWQKLVDTAFSGTELASREGAYWFMNPLMLGTLIKSRADSVSASDNAGLPLFAPAAGIGPAIANTMLGWPYKAHSGILTNRTVGSGSNRTNIYYGPPRTIIFGDLLGFSIDLNPYAKFSSFQVDIRGLKRTGILVGVPAAWTKYTGIDRLLLMAP